MKPNFVSRTTIKLLSILIITGLVGVAPVAASPTPVYNDPWDVSQGAVVTGNSPLTALGVFDIKDMFGGMLIGGTEPGNTIFEDAWWVDPGHLNLVTWQTLAPVTLTGCNLIAAHDGTWNGSIRSFREFILEAKDAGNNWQTLVDFATPFPYLDDGTYGYLARFLSFSGGAFTAQEFRATFVGRDNDYGPRIVELDAVAIPLPGTLLLVGSGLLGVAGSRRSRKS